jgi:hypothetical protein
MKHLTASFRSSNAKIISRFFERITGICELREKSRIDAIIRAVVIDLAVFGLG